MLILPPVVLRLPMQGRARFGGWPPGAGGGPAADDPRPLAGADRVDSAARCAGGCGVRRLALVVLVGAAGDVGFVNDTPLVVLLTAADDGSAGARCSALMPMNHVVLIGGMASTRHLDQDRRLAGGRPWAC
ncbi:MAG: hypothetical protein H6931_09875 [Burkholderiaceae bacterium]|nr:hypothetical protein [Burkholderiaceae bacterium]